MILVGLIAGIVYGLGLVPSFVMAMIHLSLQGSGWQALAMTLAWPIYWPYAIIKYR